MDNLNIGEIQVDVEPRSVYLMFVPSYYERWKYLAATTPPAVDEIAIVDAKFEEKFREALKTVGKSYDVKATTPIVCKMIDIIVGKEDTSDWDYIADIFGAKVPKEVGLLLRKVVATMKETKDVTDKNKWQALEYLGADYLGK